MTRKELVDKINDNISASITYQVDDDYHFTEIDGINYKIPDDLMRCFMREIYPNAETSFERIISNPNDEVEIIVGG